MKKTINLIIALIAITIFSTSCTENNSNGERIGTITQFSKAGTFFKSYEGHLNVTQTGMNSSTGFDFSIDNDDEPVGIVTKLDSAANFGWKVKLVYHKVKGWNWLSNRGNTDFFVTDVIVLDRQFDNPFGNKNGATGGHAIDTIYVVITPSDPNYLKFFKQYKETAAVKPQDTLVTLGTN